MRNFRKLVRRIQSVTGILILIASIMLIQCGSKSSPVSPPSDKDVSVYITQGWLYFEQNPPNYVLALDQFNQALSGNSNSVEAYVGRGWVYALTAFGSNDNKYLQAKNDFTEATNRSRTNSDARAGLALVLLVLNHYQQAIANADSVLSANPQYQFVHYPRITATVLKLVKVQSYFFLGQYNEVVILLNELQPGVTHPADKPEVLLLQIQELTGELLR